LQTIGRVIVPASLSGIVSAVLLGLGRVIGETMVVLLCAGNRIAIPDFTQGLGAFFQPVHTMTGIIAQEMGEVVRGSIHYRALFTTQGPFINVPFFTQGPQTLFVFEYEGKKYTLSDREFRAWKAQHPVEVEATSVAYSAGGVWPCIVGTGLLVVGSMIFALAVGICSAIYLNEYSQNTRSIRLIRIAILNLAGVPSIVFGLFGFGLFVIFFHWNVSLLA